MNSRNPDIAFTRNPVRFTDTSPGDSALRTFTVSVGSRHVYTGNCRMPATVDVSEIVDVFVPSIPDPDIAGRGEAIMISMENAETFADRLVRVTDSEGVSLMTDFFAIPGGISPQNFRMLKQLDKDIFSARLLDKRHNFFLTTRTHGWRIVLDELELFPLCFINLREEDAPISLRAAGTEFATPELQISRGIHAIDIEAVRRHIALNFGFLASAFDVLYDGFIGPQIVIRQTNPEKDPVVVKFRNSMGAFELLHLSESSGKVARMERASQDWRRYDVDTDRYVGFSPRCPVSVSVDALSGFKSDDDRRFLLDMAASDEVYLRRRSGWVRAVPSIEEVQLDVSPPAPSSIKVSFTIADEYDSLTPDIMDLKDFEHPRIFSDQFTDPFN